MDGTTTVQGTEQEVQTNLICLAELLLNGYR